MKQVTYTHTDGNVTVFTANTEIVSTRTIPAIFFANLTLAPNQHVVGDTQGESVTIASTSYVTDWGLGIWAKERLSEGEYAEFVANVAIWDANPTVNLYEDDNFKLYWTRFYHDEHVTMVEE